MSTIKDWLGKRPNPPRSFDREQPPEVGDVVVVSFEFPSGDRRDHDAEDQIKSVIERGFRFGSARFAANGKRGAVELVRERLGTASSEGPKATQIYPVLFEFGPDFRRDHDAERAVEHLASWARETGVTLARLAKMQLSADGGRALIVLGMVAS